MGLSLPFQIATHRLLCDRPRLEHLSSFNRWCAVIGNYLTLPSAVAALLGRPKTAAALFGLGTIMRAPVRS
jgi:hypothetical protein